MNRLTKLQNEFINQNLRDGFVAFPLSVFKSEKYKEWKRRTKPFKIAKNLTKNKKGSGYGL